MKILITTSSFGKFDSSPVEKLRSKDFEIIMNPFKHQNTSIDDYLRWETKSMNFTSKDYLPNSEKRIERLRKIINRRPVAILAAGPSIKQLEDRIEELKHADICYFGFNRFIQEKFISRQIVKSLSVFMQSTGPFLREYINDVISFLNRDEQNLFVSSFFNDTFSFMDNSFDLDCFLNRYDEKLLFFGVGLDRTVPSEDQPLHFPWGNSLMLLIQLALIGKASRIVLFGADGGCKENSNQTHYRENEYYPVQDRDMKKLLAWDVNMGFNPILPISIRNIYKTYKIPSIDILNCSKESFYTPFPIISYDDAFEYLLTNKKFDRKSDLRIPKASVISLYNKNKNNEGELKKTVESVSNQSYSNHEHIIVYDEADNEMRDMMRQFPDARWISEKSVGYLQAFKKGISMARGEYIFHCRIADGYSNQDWFNTCVEVLENNPDISLVWGLSQYMLDGSALGRIPDAHFIDNLPSQKKYFLYYWLKKKVLFPEGNFCVRKKVLEECFPFSDAKARDEREAWNSFSYRFNVLGYQPYFVPTIANYCRVQSDIDQERRHPSPSWQRWTTTYHMDIEQYKRKLIRRQIAHRYRNGYGELLPGGFSRRGLLFYVVGRYIKDRLPNACLLVMEKTIFFWRTYRWGAFSVVTVRAWHRLIGVLTHQTSNKVNNAG